MLEDDNTDLKIETFNKYIDSIIIWLYILNQHSSKQCVSALEVYFYFTSLEKKIPNLNEIFTNVLDVLIF